ncbi:bifunctional proline dehydrogenase/L-glutamate gamma-semialdehyde dehydrogenase PutA [Alphaproteobacteria bacterium KMM 3653]|uniref:Bifunctional protein PutA n=1 Tax=Harenicola maris TaxID=2841044 RepID=A0AAP2G3V3_9RHOB|nr:bifunctional proline dehydrogenase/L-glutamate gamma-semialdehyde dehydrogenase PutA [Harenicola maris]
MSNLPQLRQTIRSLHLQGEDAVLDALQTRAAITEAQRAKATASATSLVENIRSGGNPGLMEVFLAEYGLSTDEGIALMCLAEALLRVPDAATIDALIEDKIAPSAWGEHLGKSSSSLVNASTWALLLTGKVLQDGKGMAAVLHNAVKKLGEPVIRAAVGRAMKELGAQFVLGETIAEAVKRGQSRAKKGYTFSYDMLGEAALTAPDATSYFTAYAEAIQALSKHSKSKDIRENPGISIKLSALHPRYEETQRARVMAELTERTTALALLAKRGGMGLNIDAEEADRLDLSLDVIEAVLRDPRLAGWDGFGVVVQAFGKRASAVIDWLYALAEELDRKIMVRLVKGAYWDTEIKRAQVEGLAGYPVFTRKCATDVSYICCAAQLLSLADRIYPQFATHNAHSVATIQELANGEAFEFQRLHGMGDGLYDVVMAQGDARCRIYAPVGTHRDLLAYLVRRLLENGANSSFVNQIVDEDVPAEEVAADPFIELADATANLPMPRDLYAPERPNSRGYDLHSLDDIAEMDAARSPFKTTTWTAAPLTVTPAMGGGTWQVTNPANPEDHVGTVTLASAQDVATAAAKAAPWAVPAQERGKALNKVADLYEANFGAFFALLTREAGKTPRDAIAEVREAVDFLRYYAARAQEAQAGPRGTVGCISPWNFPLAIFTGQIAAALGAGNAVLAKPAESTGLIAHRAVQLMLEAGVPQSAIQLLPGEGGTVGAALSVAPLDAMCFTGSVATAQRINRAMAEHMRPDVPLVAETGGLNAMIVDSTALPEQAVRDIIASSFQSAGQRCSALRVLYLQEDIAPAFLDMLYGAMDELVVGDPWDYRSDLGPVIDSAAKAKITAHIEAAKSDGRLLKRLAVPATGHFVGPAVIQVGGIEDLAEEIFGPVLHIATFAAEEIDSITDAINASGYGLTFGIHSRIDDRIEQVTQRLKVGNIYVNRNQIGAVVGSQPFGGEGLSGTGPKAGGPHYLAHFTGGESKQIEGVTGPQADQAKVQSLIDAASGEMPELSQTALPGPTGESNRLSVYGRGIVLCLGPTAEAARDQARIARLGGCRAIAIAPGLTGPDSVDGILTPEALGALQGLAAVASWAQEDEAQTLRRALAGRDGPLIPLLTEADFTPRIQLERHICIDTTAAGGNASLLAEQGA